MVRTPPVTTDDPFGSDLPSVPRVRRQGQQAPSPKSALPSRPRQPPPLQRSRRSSSDAEDDVAPKMRSTVPKRSKQVTRISKPVNRPTRLRRGTGSVIDSQDLEDEMSSPDDQDQRDQGGEDEEDEDEEEDDEEVEDEDEEEDEEEEEEEEDEDDVDEIDTDQSDSLDGERKRPSTSVLVTKKRNIEFDDFSDNHDSDSSNTGTKSHGSQLEPRLTMRQRALQGEDLGAALSKLASPPKRLKKAPDDELTNDETLELKRQQKARLRNLVHEKRSKDKRAATVDKVLRGVTSKRKKLSQANEALAAEVGSRLSNNESRRGFIRYRSCPAGAFISVAPGEELPVILSNSQKVCAYPMPCTRDPRTGKRIFPGTGSLVEHAANDEHRNSF